MKVTQQEYERDKSNEKERRKRCHRAKKLGRNDFYIHREIRERWERANIDRVRKREIGSWRDGSINIL